MLEELRSRSEAGTGRGSPPDEDRLSHGCIQMKTDETEGQQRPDPSEETSGREDCVADLTSDIVSSICDVPCSSDAEAGLAGVEREAVTDPGSSARHEENRQNKPTVERSTVVEKGPRVDGLVRNEAKGAHRPDRESDDSGPARRPAASVDECARSDSHKKENKKEKDMQSRLIHSHTATAWQGSWPSPPVGAPRRERLISMEYCRNWLRSLGLRRSLLSHASTSHESGLQGLSTWLMVTSWLR
jgi:hypothetical protein